MVLVVLVLALVGAGVGVMLMLHGVDEAGGCVGGVGGGAGRTVGVFSP